VALTHPAGALKGGPPSVPAYELRAYAQDLVEIHQLGSKEELERHIINELGKKGQALESLLKEHKRLKEGNERVTNRLRALEEERDMEVRHEERWRSEKERKGR
jgi:hypothetical protein